MKILQVFELSQTVWSATRPAGDDPKTMERYGAVRDAGRHRFEGERRPTPGGAGGWNGFGR